ncbi:cytochrome P450 [Bombardia bombarda]|uniref:Cytochrome P450 n=1 Tax=Bombardia bombarda TaxID=252184 RepID=A0AA40BV78_9PEZI|nr:cytochrome P450 [Bombardia bombarda]
MASHGSGLPPWAEFSDPASKPLTYLITAFMVVLLLYSLQGPGSPSTKSLPHLNPKHPFEFSDTRPKKAFVSGAREMVAAWFRSNPDKPTRIISDFGELTLLPPLMADELRNDKRLSFSGWTYRAFHAHLPGFEGFREGTKDSQVVQAVIMRDLTKYLNKVTEPLAEETSLALAELLPASPASDWQTVPLRETMLRLLARISSRVFLGEELCRDEAWLKVTREYTVDGFRAAEELRLWPAPTRFFVHWFLPLCRRARAHVSQARRVIGPVLERRRQQKKAYPTVQFDDALEWFEQTAKGQPYDPAIVQLVMSLAAIHTTTDLVCQVLIDIAGHPEILQPLREEMITTLREHGWKKMSLYNMKLLDSVIKETQRVKPIGIVAMRRVALERVELSDGTVIPKNGVIAVSSHRLWDAHVHENPDRWDGYRFLRMRETPGRENQAQLVSTSQDHIAFGHGQHACPGRFFAANETKVALIYLLLRYDWRISGGAVAKARSFGFSLGADPFLKMDYRERKSEVVL